MADVKVFKSYANFTSYTCTPFCNLQVAFQLFDGGLAIFDGKL